MFVWKWGYAMDDLQAKLLTEQFNHLRDSIESRFQRIEKDLKHHSQLETEKLNAIRSSLKGIRDDMQDHENRIRKIDDLVKSPSTVSNMLSQMHNFRLIGYYIIN